MKNSVEKYFNTLAYAQRRISKRLLSSLSKRPRTTCLQLTSVLLCAVSVANILLSTITYDDAKPHYVHLPEGKTLQNKVVVSCVGDILLGDSANTTIEEQGYAALFDSVRPALQHQDILMANLEAPVSSISENPFENKLYSYNMPDEVLQALQREGVALFVLANNHVLDRGLPGFEETIRNLQLYGFPLVGAGMNERDARRGLVLTFRNRLRLGVLAYMEEYKHYNSMNWYARGEHPGVAKADTRAMAEDIQRMRKYADVVIVHLHAGANYKKVTTTQKWLARFIIDAGADVVNGHHAHTAQPVEIYRGKPIVYSEGNFVFGTRGRFRSFRSNPFGFLVRYELGKKGVEALEVNGFLVDNRIVDYQPKLLDSEQMEKGLLPILNSKGAEFELKGNVARLEL